jgi:serine-type D-Ala-D-Ala carboxypeptidase (penicillin-binding protein 5/6)
MQRSSTGTLSRWGAAVAVSAAVVSVAAPATTAQAATGPSGIGAKGAYLLDDGTDSGLWAKDGDAALPMASTTKIMTALVVLDDHGASLGKKVTVKRAYRDYVADEGASTADLQTGDQLTVEQLLYGMMLPSGCDAAYALADTFGTGSTMAQRTSSFISEMNDKAKSLGLTHTTYDSFDGISQGGHNATSPRDLAELTRDAMANPTFDTIVDTQSTRQQAANVDRTYTWYNTNELLGSYPGAIGVKTGTTTAAGDCLVFAAKRNGRTVIGVVLNDADRYPDAKTMLDWAFGTDTKVTWRRLPAGAQQD